MSATGRNVTGFVAASATLVPIILLIVTRLVWTSAPSKVPSHFEGEGTADAFSSSSQIFIGCLLLTAVVVVAAFAIAFLGGDLDPSKRGFALGATNLVSAVTGLTWIVLSLSEVNANNGGSANIGSPFLLFLCAIDWGLVGFLITFPFRRSTP